MAAKILIAEDDAMSMRLLTYILRHQGYEVLEANNGEEALTIARERLPDLILMDILMPVMDGYAATKRLHEDPLTRAIKVIAVTSYAMRGDSERFMDAGFVEYVTKPIDPLQLPAIIKKHLGAG